MDSTIPPAQNLAQTVVAHGSTCDPDQVSPEAAPLPCPRCGALAVPRVGPGKGPHFRRLLCSGCGAFLRWAPKPRPPVAAPSASPEGEVVR